MIELEKNESLLRLVCGYDFDNDIEIDKILQHLSDSLRKVISEIIDLPSLENDKLSLYGPYLGRSLLELSVTALLARIDPFKILLMKNKQEQPDYELGKPQSPMLIKNVHRKNVSCITRTLKDWRLSNHGI